MALRIGVIGLGKAGKKHMEALEKIPDVEPKGFDYAPYITQWEELDGVIIASPDDTHFGYIRRAFSYDVSVMVEKPAVVSLDELNVLKHFLSIPHSPLFTSCFPLRLSPDFQNLRRKLQEDLKSRSEVRCVHGYYQKDSPSYLISNWRASIPTYTPILGGGIHYVDLIQWMFGAESLEIGLIAGPNMVTFRGDSLPHAVVSADFNAPDPDGPKLAFDMGPDFGSGVFSSDIIHYYRTRNPGVAAVTPLFVESIRSNSLHPLLPTPEEVLRVVEICLKSSRKEP